MKNLQNSTQRFQTRVTSKVGFWTLRSFIWKRFTKKPTNLNFPRRCHTKTWTTRERFLKQKLTLVAKLLKDRLHQFLHALLSNLCPSWQTIRSSNVHIQRILLTRYQIWQLLTRFFHHFHSAWNLKSNLTCLDLSSSPKKLWIFLTWRFTEDTRKNLAENQFHLKKQVAGHPVKKLMYKNEDSSKILAGTKKLFKQISANLESNKKVYVKESLKSFQTSFLKSFQKSSNKKIQNYSNFIHLE